MPNSSFEEIELTLKSEDLVTNYKFEGCFLGEATYVDEQDEELPKETIRIYQNKDEKFVSYMEYSTRDEGIFESKVCVTDELKLAKIKRELTKESYDFGGLQIVNVPSEILGIAVYNAVNSIEKGISKN